MSENNRVPKVLWSFSGREIVEAYERAITNGEETSLDRFFRMASPQDLAAVTYGLVARNIAHRQQQGETPTLEDYLTYAPEQRPLIEALLISNEQVKEWLKKCGYMLLQPIAQGRTGGVFKVSRSESGTPSAATIIPSGVVKDQLLDESGKSIDLAYMLHPNIARPTELTEIDGNIFLFNHFVVGPSVLTLAEREQRVSVGVACEIIRQAALGLDPLHENDRSHGAVTPASLLLCREGDDRGLVKVSGIGLSDFADLSLLRFGPDGPGGSGLAWQRFCPPEYNARNGLITPRGDVYSLGTLLIALLIGRVPSRLSRRFEKGNKNEQSVFPTKSSQRELMSNVLEEANQSIPEELPAVLIRMVSLLPAARYADGREVAEALSPFARVDELESLLEELAPETPGARSPRLSWVAPEVDEKNTQDDPPPIEQTESQEHEPVPTASVNTETPPSVLPAKSKKRPLIGIALGLFALIAVVLAVVFLWPKPPAETPKAEWVVTFVEMPGRSGEWWFDETPWLTPSVRQRVSHLSQAEVGELQTLAAIVPKTVDSPASDFTQLKYEVQSLVPQSDDVETMVFHQLLSMNHVNRNLEGLRQDYARLADQLTNAQTPTAIHLRAVLRHSARDFPAASADYKKAVDLYESEPHLLALCGMDYCRMLVEYRQYNLANWQLENVVLTNADSLPLIVTARCLQAETYRKWDGQFARSAEALRAAEQQLHESGAGDSHPLMSVVTEAKAWNAFDQWELPWARKQFQEALRQREAAQEAGDPRAWQSIFWDKQGLAMVEHFTGRQESAVEIYTELLDSIKTALSSVAGGALGRLPRLHRERLASRRPNLSERLGDCYLFGPDENAAEAAKSYAAAEEFATGEGFDLAAKWPFIVAIGYKRVVALLRAGQIPKARQALTETEERVERHLPKSRGSASEPSDKQSQVYALNRELALTLLQMHDANANQPKALRDLEAVLRGTTPDRKTLDMYLLGSQVLLESLDAQPEQVARVVRRVATNISQFMEKSQGEEDLRYFQRYAEFAVRSGSIANHRLAKEGQVGDEVEKLEQIASRGASLEEPFEVKPESLANNQFHSLTVGVSKYLRHSAKNPLNLPCAAGDATDMSAAFQMLCRTDSTGMPASSVGVFQAGLSRVLTDERATRKNIFAFFDELKQLRGADIENDLVVVSIAGHGVLDDFGFLYFLPHDYEPGQLLSSGIDVDQLKKQLSFLRSNAVLILDTCHSGAALKSSSNTLIAKRNVNEAEVSSALKSFASSGRGVIVMAASCAQERASEGTPFAGHGALTAAVLEFIRQKQFPIATKANQRPTDLTIASVNNVVTLEGLRRYVQDRLNQFQHLNQSPLVRVVSGYDVGNYDPAKIPLRLLSP